MKQLLMAGVVLSVSSLCPVAGVRADPAQAVAGQQAAATGELRFSVVIIDDLVPKPVPLTDFSITNASDATSKQTMRTDAAGTFTVTLPPGSYTIESAHPVSFKTKSYTWKSTVTITAGATATLAMTDTDAQATEISAPTQSGGAGAIYKSLKDGIVTVEGDFGSGSGFIIDKSGLILTNEHVVHGSTWAAVRFDRGHRLEARVVVADAAADVAVLQTDVSSYPAAVAIPLATQDDVAAVAVGDQVIAIGSPLHQEKILTEGIVSKINKDSLISDVNINHGNSGGPLLNMAGKAIGLTTFLDPGSPNGPGISGVVLVTKALPVIDTARAKLATDTAPSFITLPDICQTPIPDDELTSLSHIDQRGWEIDAPKNFVTQVVTPFLLAARQEAYENNVSAERNRRIKKRDSDGAKEDTSAGPNHFWMQYVDNQNDPVVIFLISPELKEKSSSVWGQVLLGNSAQRTFEFRDDFYDMVLMHGDDAIQSVRRERFPVRELYADGNSYVNDTAYAGVYMFDPSAFDPAKPIVMKMRRASNIKQWDEVKISDKMQRQIWDQFAAYRTYMASQGTTPLPAVKDVAAAK